jgi:uridine phosphorylase
MTIQPHILCKKGDIAKNVILPGDPGRVLRMAKFLDDAREISFNREYRVVTGKYKGIPVSICSTGIGGPSTAIAMEELIAIGAKNFIRVGSCGANQSEINVGDLVIADSVVREDHTCLDYVSVKYPAIADPDTFQIMKEVAKELKFKHYTGTTVTIDGLFSPRTKEVKDTWKKFNTLAQDMEAGTVLTLARVKRVRAGVVLLVVDHEAEKNIKQKIAEYAISVNSGEGKLVKMEEKGFLVALESFVKLDKKD